MVSGMANQPLFHSGMFMSRVIIHNQMNFEVLGDIGFDML